jgi:RNA polymerase sigma-70 factor (ECF subfamily)
VYRFGILVMQISTRAVRDASSKLILRIARRDRAALKELHDTMGDTLFSVLNALLGNENLAKMTYMELLPMIWRDAPDFQPGLQDGASWVISRTRRLGIKRVRKLNPNRRLLADGIDVEEAAISGKADLLAAKSAAKLVNRCIGHLPPCASDLVVASYIFGFSRTELVELFGKTAETVNQTLLKAGHLLKICMRGPIHGT